MGMYGVNWHDFYAIGFMGKKKLHECKFVEVLETNFEGQRLIFHCGINSIYSLEIHISFIQRWNYGLFTQMNS
jgi:hypothetical protein